MTMTDEEVFGTKPVRSHDDVVAEYNARRAAVEAEVAKLDAEKDSLVIESDGTVVEPAEAGADVEKADKWLYDTIEFYGETLEVRQPTEQALSGFSLAAGKYIPPKLQNDLVGLFLKQHMSAASHERVFVRLLDPEDESYTPKTLGELMRTIALLNKNIKPE